MEEVQGQWICGFWRRIGAFVIDTLFLGVFGYVLGLFLEDVFVQLGGWGRLIGFVISITYFGVMNSHLANGQTFGKKLLNIRVVDASNSVISLPKSFVRYSFLAIPFSLNGIQITDEALLPYLLYPLTAITFGGLFSILYLYIFNRATRQSLHDIAVGTFVVNTGSQAEAVPSIWKPHYVVVAILFIAALFIPVFTSGMAQSEPFKGLLAAQEAIVKNSAVKYAGVTEGTTTLTSIDKGSTTTTYVSAQAFLYKNEVSNTVFAKQLAQTLADTYPESLNKNYIQVTLTYGYDIGIASSWNHYTHQFAPKELATSE